MVTKPQHNTIPQEFEDIAPYDDSMFKEKIKSLVRESGFENAVKYVMPNVDYPALVNQLLSVENQKDFQYNVMGQVLESLEKATTSGIKLHGLENISEDESYTFITNHRDIVLDASFLNLGFIRAGYPITQIAIGNNLLIYEWITDLVKLNRSIIVKRDVKMARALEAAKQLSGYIHYTINQLHESVWIAQREGRAKDSNDLTQESLIKMISLAGDGSVKENILSAHLCPVSISYEYDPNDYLKAREFLLKQRDPQFKKSQHDDLFSMETGILKHKGRVTFRIGGCINDDLEACTSENRAEIVRETCRLIDNKIHAGYEIYQCNYIAYDEINEGQRFADKYTADDERHFNEYVESQLDKVQDIGAISQEERQYMRHMMLTMYANPLKNKLQVESRL
ncbi:MAG: hypothetical protein NC548_49175 [Lachnospiraceae bacterium]|nr:hypothetical protein [Lachnospiraceae bacterium]